MRLVAWTRFVRTRGQAWMRSGRCGMPRRGMRDDGVEVQTRICWKLYVTWGFDSVPFYTGMVWDAMVGVGFSCQRLTQFQSLRSGVPPNRWRYLCNVFTIQIGGRDACTLIPSIGAWGRWAFLPWEWGLFPGHWCQVDGRVWPTRRLKLFGVVGLGGCFWVWP